MKWIYLIIFSLYVIFLTGQNLILNSSFSDVISPLDSNKWHKINFKGKSDVLNWYIPGYFANTYGGADAITHYFTSRDIKHHVKRNIYTNYEHLFSNNLGFLRIYTNYCMQGVIQQQFAKCLNKGLYCFKFKYKRMQTQDVSGDDLNFCFSDSDLRNYFNGNCINLPDSMIAVTLNDSISNSTAIPWQQVCKIIELKGNEKYITVGALKYSEGKMERQNKFYLDEFELVPVNPALSCECEKIDRDLKLLYNRAFVLDKIIQNDSLAVFAMVNPSAVIDPNLISPENVSILNQIISFMQKNPNVKIKFIQYDQFNVKRFNPPQNYILFERYMNFYGIRKDRILTEWGDKIDPKDYLYYGVEAKFIKMSMLFFK